MNKQTWYFVWLLILIIAGIFLYPYAYKAFAKPTLTVYVIDPANFQPVNTGSVYLNYAYIYSHHGEGMLYDMKLDKKGKATFVKIPDRLLNVSYRTEAGMMLLNVDGIKIGKHDGNVKMYLYYHNNISGDESSSSMNPSVPVDTTMTTDQPSAPTREQANAVNENETPAYEQIYAVLYDDIRLRDKPALDGKVMATLKTNDEVTYAGEESGNRSLITIKGEPQLSTWIKVKTKKGIVGWVIKSALQEYNNDESWD